MASNNEPLLVNLLDEDSQTLDLPKWAVNSQTQSHFKKYGLSGPKTSMADYCGPCHKLARRACICLIASEALGVFLGWRCTADVWKIVVALQPFNVIVLVLEWCCLRYVLLPWQHTLVATGTANFSLPLISKFCQCDFCTWAIGVSFVSLGVCVSLQHQAVNTGRAFHQHTLDFNHYECINGLCFMATFLSLVWVFGWSEPVDRDVRWDFDRNRENTGLEDVELREEDKEIRYATVASQWEFVWPGTHYEALMRYAHYAGMFGVQQMTNSLQEAEAQLFWYATKDFERKCSNRVEMVMRFNFFMVLFRVLLRTVPQVCLSTWQYHRYWQSWWSLGPLSVNLFVFLCSDLFTFFTTESFYGEFTSQLLSDREPKHYVGQCKEMMDSSKRFRQWRLTLMALSLVLIWLCVCLVIADGLCKPFQVSNFTCSSYPHQHLTGIVVLLVVFFIGGTAVYFWWLFEPMPLFEPPARLNDKKLYVDEDAPKYYWHVPKEAEVTMICDHKEVHTHLGEFEEHSFLKVKKDRQTVRVPFNDDKLLRVQERGQQKDILPCTKERKEFLLRSANQNHWFELALRFGKELTLAQWRKEVSKHPKRKMVKLTGFDGGERMNTAFWNRATQQLLEADVVLWDGDWYCQEAWTGMIETFLKAKPKTMAVAFQKKAEVPGFHRSYWELYQRFPNRIQIVVLNDECMHIDVCPKKIRDQLEWLKEQWDQKRLQRPFSDRYLTVAMLGRTFQRNFERETPVIAMNGGIISTNLAALETSLNAFPKIEWTVYEASRVRKQPPVEETLVHYASQQDAQNNPNLKLVR